jgi:hypothetical protein
VKYFQWSFICALFISANAVAGVDKVYDPFVHEGEIEIEIRAAHNFDDSDEHKVRFGVGYGVNSVWYVEGYLIGKQETGGSFDIVDIELENKFQLTEQGEYWLDVGLLIELEKSTDGDVWEVVAGPLFQKQFNDWVATTNFFVEKKFGSDISTRGVELKGAAQLKYRLSPGLEPALEYYGDEDAHSIGPAMLGKTRWGNTPVKWEIGAYAGLNDDAPDFTFRWLLEWEFY